MADPELEEDPVGHYEETLSTRYCERCGWPTPRAQLRRDGFTDSMVCSRRGCWSPDEPADRPIPTPTHWEP
jgi:hypothetical protein